MRLQLPRALAAVGVVTAMLAAFSAQAQAQSSTPCASRYPLAWAMPLGASDVGRSVNDVFKRSDFKTVISPRGALNRIAIGRAPTGEVGLQMNIPKGENRSTSFFLAPFGDRGVDAACLSLKVFFENGFEWAKGGGGTKLGFGLWGGDAASQLSGGTAPSKQLGWSVRNVNNSWGVRLYSYHLNRSSQYGEQGQPLARWGSDKWKPGRWHELQLEVVMNEPGKSNGYTQIWLDGGNRQSMTNLRFRNNDKWGIRGIHFSDIWGGATNDPNNFSPKSQRMWYAGYKLYTGRGSTSVQASGPSTPSSKPTSSPTNPGSGASGSGGKFGAVSPNGAVNGTGVTLNWRPDASADKYYVRVLTKRKNWSDRKEIFSGSVWPRSCNGSQCSLSIGKLSRDQYEWMVRPQYGSRNGNYSVLSFDVR